MIIGIIVITVIMIPTILTFTVTLRIITFSNHMLRY